MAILAEIRLFARAFVAAVRETVAREIAEFGRYRAVSLRFGPQRFIRVHPRYVAVLGGIAELPEVHFNPAHFSQFIAGLRAIVEEHATQASLNHLNGCFNIEARKAADDKVVIAISGGSWERYAFRFEDIRRLIRNDEEAVAVNSHVATSDTPQ